MNPPIDKKCQSNEGLQLSKKHSNRLLLARKCFSSTVLRARVILNSRARETFARATKKITPTQAMKVQNKTNAAGFDLLIRSVNHICAGLRAKKHK